MKKALQKLGLTFALAVIFCVAFVICANAQTFNVEYRDSGTFKGFDDNTMAAATWTGQTNPDGTITLPSEKISADKEGYTFFGWYTIEGDVYYPGETVTLTRDTKFFEAYGIEVNSYPELQVALKSVENTGIYIRLGNSISDKDPGTTNSKKISFNNHTTAIIDFNGFEISLSFAGDAYTAVEWSGNNAGYVFVGQGKLTFTATRDEAAPFGSTGNSSGGSPASVDNRMSRLWIGKNVTIESNKNLMNFAKDGNYGWLPFISIRIYGTVKSQGFLRGYISASKGSTVDFFEGCNVELASEKFINVLDDSYDLFAYITIHGGTFDLGEASTQTTYWYDDSSKWEINILAGTFKYKFPGSLLDEGYQFGGSEGNWIVKSVRCPYTSDGKHVYGKHEMYYGIVPTCMLPGTWLQQCDYCDYINETHADPLGHDYQISSATPATPSRAGLCTWTCQRDDCDGEKTVTRKLFPTVDIMEKVIVTVVDANGKEIQIELTIGDIFEYELILGDAYSDHILNIKSIKAIDGYSIDQIVGINLPLGVTSISIPKNTTLKYIDVSRTEYISLTSKNFEGFTALEKFVFGDYMDIGDYAFQNCTSLREVVIEGVSNITFSGGYIFYGCTSLTEFVIGDNCHSIYFPTKGALGSATNNLSIIRVGDNCTDIRFEAGYIIDASNTISEMHFGKSQIFFGVSSMVTSSGSNVRTPVTILTFSTGEYTFSDASFAKYDIEELIFPDGMQVIWSNPKDTTFSSCSKLKYLYIGEGITELARPFNGCNSLETLIMMSVESIGDWYCFGGESTTMLTVYIHSTKLSLQTGTFANKKGGITIYTLAPITNASAFNGCDDNFTIYYGIPHAFETHNFDATCTEGAYYGYEYNCPGCGKGSFENGTIVKKFVGVYTNSSDYEEIVLEKTYVNGEEGFGHDTENGTIVAIVYENGFFKKGIKTVKCAICGEDLELEALAIFVVKGYSVASDGSAIISGYTLNMLTEEKTVLSEYEDLYGTITYGVLFVNVNDNNIENLTFVDGVIQTSKTLKAIQVKVNDEDREYVAFNYRVNKFDPSLPNYADLKIVMAAYVIDENGNISFGQGSSVEEGGNVEYVKSVGVVGTNQTLGAVTLRTLYKKSDFNDQYYGQYFTEASEDND